MICSPGGALDQKEQALQHEPATLMAQVIVASSFGMDQRGIHNRTTTSGSPNVRVLLGSRAEAMRRYFSFSRVEVTVLKVFVRLGTRATCL